MKISESPQHQKRRTLPGVLTCLRQTASFEYQGAQQNYLKTRLNAIFTWNGLGNKYQLKITENLIPSTLSLQLSPVKLTIRLLRCICDCSGRHDSQQGLFLHKDSPQNPVQMQRQRDCKAHSIHWPYKFGPLKLGLRRAIKFGNTSKKLLWPTGNHLAPSLLEVELN